MHIIRLLRPHHWTKNLLVFAGVVFGGRIQEPGSWLLGLWTFLAFCLMSSGVYAVNDVMDRRRDVLHPRKALRPVAAGAVRPGLALAVGTTLMGLALLAGWVIHGGVLLSLTLYLVANVLYFLGLKHVALLDVMAIAVGFVFRLLAGIYALGDLPTSWIVLCTFFLAVFLGFAKRRAELAVLRDPAQRPVLGAYTLEYLDSALGASATMAVLCYALFTVTADKNHFLIVTVPVVYYAVMHYTRMAMTQGSGEEPERLLLRDARIPASILIWVILYAAIELWNPSLFR